MIVNQEHALAVLYHSSYAFYLTGSRFFGQNHQLSDWDFFVENTEGLQDWLKYVGFSKVSDPNYDSPDICELWVKDSIQIQVVLDAALKARLQAKLRHSKLFLNASKEMRKQIWNLAYSLAEPE